MVDYVTFPAGLGGNGLTYSSDDDPNTGMDDGGYAVRMIPMIGQTVVMAQTAVDAADSATASAASALNAPGTNSTSTTSLSIGTGTKTLTIQTGKAYVTGQTLTIASTASPSNQMTGIVTTYTPGTGALVVEVPVGATQGSGTFSAWTVSMGVIVNSTLPTLDPGKFLYNTGGVVSWQTALTPSGNLAGLADKATARSNLDLVIGTHVQAYNAALASIAGLTTAANKMIYATASNTYATTDLTLAARQLLDDADFSTMRTTLGLAIGTNVQAYNGNLAALAGLTLVADRLPYANGSGTLVLTPLTSFGRSLIDDANAAASRSTLELGALSVLDEVTPTQFTGQLPTTKGGTGANYANTAALRLGVLPAVTNLPGAALQVNSGGTDWETAWRAMVTFSVSGSTATILASRNVASVTRTDTGDFTIAFTNAAPDAYYAGGGMGNRVGSGDSMITSSSRTSTWSESAAYITFSTQGGTPDDPGIARLQFGY